MYFFLIIGLVFFFLLYADDLSLIILAAAVLLPPVLFVMLLYARGKIRITPCDETVRCVKGSETEIQFKAENSSLIPVSAVKLIVKVRFIPGTEEESYYVSVPLPAKSSQYVGVKIKSEVCRRAEISVVSVKVCDYLHLFKLRKRDAEQLRAAADFLPDGSTRISPDTEEQLSVKESISGEADFSSFMQQEFDDLRPYRDGDKLNRVAWKLSGKTNDDIIVRDSSSRRESVYLLVMDIHSAKDDPAEIDRLYELFGSAAEVMCSHEISFDSVKADGSILKNISAADRLDECIASVYGGSADIDSICRNVTNRRYDKIVLAAAGDCSDTADKLIKAYGAREALIIK